MTRVIEVVSTRPHGISLADLAREVDAPKSSIQGFVNGLVFAGYLAEHDHRYILGGAPSVLALRANRMLAQTVRHDDLVDLHEQTGCNVLLGVRVGHHVVYIDEVGEGALLEYVSRTRQNRPLLQTAAGKMLLACLNQAEMYALLAELPDQDAVTQYLEQVSAIQKDGYALNRHSIDHSHGAVACPVRDRAGNILAAVTLTTIAETVITNQQQLAALLNKATDLWASRTGEASDPSTGPRVTM
ncbi:IclR family transcriptional regulator [Rhodococcus koreensis]|uniref:IclR family transcriptional regulator n=1 Tax=Rhodococcus koreensis TaxID=99653 RepID=UPI003671C49E